jgi:hypothetical protein
MRQACQRMQHRAACVQLGVATSHHARLTLSTNTSAESVNTSSTLSRFSSSDRPLRLDMLVLRPRQLLLAPVVGQHAPVRVCAVVCCARCAAVPTACTSVGGVDSSLLYAATHRQALGALLCAWTGWWIGHTCRLLRRPAEQARDQRVCVRGLAVDMLDDDAGECQLTLCRGCLAAPAVTI